MVTSSGALAAQSGTLVERIFAHTRYLAKGQIQAGSFLNRRIVTNLMTEIGKAVAAELARGGV
ncbi:MAG: hypothetical protein R3E57_08400 [Porticoccaceae bacterium]